MATAPSPASSGTSLVVATGDGAKFPSVPFNATVWPANAQPLTSNAEIVRVTNISTDTLTIIRAQESSSARSIVVGDQIAATITAKTLTDIEGLTVASAAGGLPNAAKAQTFPRVVTGVTAQTVTSGTLVLAGIDLRAGISIASITFVSGSTALSGGTHQIVGIYDDSLGSSSSTSYGLLAQSSDGTNGAWTATTAKTFNLTSTYTPVRSGFHYVGLLVVATQTPNLKSLVSDGILNAIPSVLGGNSSSTGLSSLPNPAGAPTAGNVAYAYVS